MTTPTPRTDAAIFHSYHGDCESEYVYPDFSRQLERELSEAKQQLKESYDHACRDTYLGKIQTDNTQLRAEIDRLKELNNSVIEHNYKLLNIRDQWREDAERLAKVLNRWTCSGLCTDPLCVMTKDTLAAHERLKGEKK